MLIEFLYTEVDLNGYSYPYDPSTEQLMYSWGDIIVENYNQMEYQLVDIPDSLLFSILINGAHDKVKLYYVYNRNKFYFCTSKSDLLNNLQNHGYGGIKGHTSSIVMENPNFDYGFSYDDVVIKPFFYEIPDDCTPDFMEHVKPYIDYKFTNTMVRLCNEFNNTLIDGEVPKVSSFNSSEISKSSKFKLYTISTNDFYFVIYEMFHGQRYKEFEELYPRTVLQFSESLVGLQNYYIKYKSTYYDPRIKS